MELRSEIVKRMMDERGQEVWRYFFSVRGLRGEVRRLGVYLFETQASEKPFAACYVKVSGGAEGVGLFAVNVPAKNPKAERAEWREMKLLKGGPVQLVAISEKVEDIRYMG